jgi:hypothetical protein
MAAKWTTESIAREAQVILAKARSDLEIFNNTRWRFLGELTYGPTITHTGKNTVVTFKTKSCGEITISGVRGSSRDQLL